MSLTFPKTERLKSERIIQKLFNKQGASFAMYPLRLVWMQVEQPMSDAPVQFGVSVPKKKFRKAVDRNRLKRQIRETWRLHKHQLFAATTNGAGQYCFMVLYTANEPLSYTEIEVSMKRIIKKFVKNHLNPTGNA